MTNTFNKVRFSVSHLKVGDGCITFPSKKQHASVRIIEWDQNPNSQTANNLSAKFLNIQQLATCEVQSFHSGEIEVSDLLGGDATLLGKSFQVFQKEHRETHTQPCNVTSQKTRILILPTCLLTNQNVDTQSNTQVRRRMTEVVAFVVVEGWVAHIEALLNYITILRNYHSTLHNIPEKSSSHLHHGQSLQSCINHCLFDMATFICCLPVQFGLNLQQTLPQVYAHWHTLTIQILFAILPWVKIIQISG